MDVATTPLWSGASKPNQKVGPPNGPFRSITISKKCFRKFKGWTPLLNKKDFRAALLISIPFRLLCTIKYQFNYIATSCRLERTNKYQFNNMMTSCRLKRTNKYQFMAWQYYKRVMLLLRFWYKVFNVIILHGSVSLISSVWVSFDFRYNAEHEQARRIFLKDWKVWLLTFSDIVISGLHWLHRLSVAVLHVTASKPGPLLWMLKTLASVQEGIIRSLGRYLFETFPSVGENFRDFGHFLLLVRTLNLISLNASPSKMNLKFNDSFQWLC